MIMPSKDNLYNGRKGISFENPSYFEKAKDLRPTLYDDKVIGLGENDCLEVEKECDKVENPKVIAPVMFKLSVSQSVSPISMTKTSCDSKNVENMLKIKRRKRKSSKQNDKQVDNDVSRDNSDFVHFSDLDTFSSVRRPKHSGVIWKKKRSSNTSNVDLSSVNLSKLNKNVKRYSHKDLLSCNNSHLGETSSASVCNDSMNISCNSRMCDEFDDNNFFIFSDESVRISPVSKMPFRKKPRASMNVLSKNNMNKSLPKTMHKYLPKLQPLAESVARWIPRIVQICLWIIDSGRSKHMTSNRALLTNFMEKFLGTVRFGNNDFTVIVGYEDVRVRTDNGTEFKNKTLAKFFDEVGITQQFSATRAPQQNGIVERRNRTLVEAARTMLTFANLPSFLWAEAIATTCFTQNRLIIHKRFDKTPYEFMNKRKANLKFFRVFGCRCYLLNDYEDVGKIKAKGDIGVFVRYSKESAAFRIYNNQTRKIHESIMKSSTTNIETLINEEVFHEVSESFQMESSSSSLNDDVQQSPKEVILPQTNTQSISNNMVPNGDEASTSHNVFSERLEDAYFDAGTSFHDPSNVHTFYQPYPHEKK
nr:putative ribonuclease H-like domain-containing protein [Tanacetum cinerariifolium]